MKKSTKKVLKNVAEGVGTVVIAGLYVAVAALAVASETDSKLKQKKMLKSEIDSLSSDVNKINTDIKTMEDNCGNGMSYADYEASRRLKAEKERQLVTKKSLYNDLERKGY